MTFDKAEHREYLLQIFQQINIPGALLDEFVALKRAVINGSVKTPFDPDSNITAEPMG